MRGVLGLFFHGAWILFGALSFAREGLPVVATVYALPGIAFLLAAVAPGSRTAALTFLAHVGGPRSDPTRGAVRDRLEHARWWLLGSVVLPVSMALLSFSVDRGNLFGDFEAILILPLPAFGIACGLMAAYRFGQAAIAALRG